MLYWSSTISDAPNVMLVPIFQNIKGSEREEGRQRMNERKLFPGQCRESVEFQQHLRGKELSCKEFSLNLSRSNYLHSVLQYSPSR